MTLSKAKEHLQRAVARANERHGAGFAPAAFVQAIDRFPTRTEDVPAYRESLAKLAPELRRPLEDALEVAS